MFHQFVLRITIANLRPFLFCWGGRFVSVFPCGGFGSLVVAGDLSRDCKTFYASRILSFHPERNFKQLQVPVRKITFYKHHAIYRDSRHWLEVLFDQASLPLLWDSSWKIGRASCRERGCMSVGEVGWEQEWDR